VGSALTLGLMVVSGQQLLWLPFCALLSSAVLAWLWPQCVLASLRLQVISPSLLRQDQTAVWQLEVSSRLPLWGLALQGPCGLRYDGFTPGRRARLSLSAQPQLAGDIEGSWHCRLRYPFDLWGLSLFVDYPNLRILPGLEIIDYLPLAVPTQTGAAPRALVCCDSGASFALGEDVNASVGVQMKLLANLCRALAARGYDVSLASSLGLLTAPAYSTGFNPIDDTLVQAQQQPVSALDLVARYNPRPDAQLIILPQLLSQAKVPELFAGQVLWQLLFDEERFLHPLSRSRHFHKRCTANHWQWVIEPQQPLARLFHVQP
jgi:hypothetical protein